jgi:hypothetical protein
LRPQGRAAKPLRPALSQPKARPSALGGAPDVAGPGGSAAQARLRCGAARKRAPPPATRWAARAAERARSAACCAAARRSTDERACASARCYVAEQGRGSAPSPACAPGAHAARGAPWGTTWAAKCRARDGARSTCCAGRRERLAATAACRRGGWPPRPARSGSAAARSTPPPDGGGVAPPVVLRTTVGAIRGRSGRAIFERKNPSSVKSARSPLILQPQYRGILADL